MRQAGFVKVWPAPAPGRVGPAVGSAASESGASLSEPRARPSKVGSVWSSHKGDGPEGFDASETPSEPNPPVSHKKWRVFFACNALVARSLPPTHTPLGSSNRALFGHEPASPPFPLFCILFFSFRGPKRPLSSRLIYSLELPGRTKSCALTGSSWRPPRSCTRNTIFVSDARGRPSPTEAACGATSPPPVRGAHQPNT